MRDLDKLLLAAFPQELEDIPPAPVNKRAVRDLTLRKLNLELSQEAALATGEQWASPVVRRPRRLAVLAACLVLTLMVGAGVALRPLLLPGTVSLTNGTYLDLTVTRAEFDQGTGEMVFDLEAVTDLDLSAQTEGNSYDWWMGVTFEGEVGAVTIRGGQRTLEQLVHWEQVGEDTYRCEGFALELLPETQLSQGLYGEREGTFSLEVGTEEDSFVGYGEHTLTDQAKFSIILPQDGPTASFETSPQVGTYFDCSVAEASFDPQQWAIVLDLEARTDLELSDPSATTSTRYQWTDIPCLHTPEGDRWVSNVRRSSNYTPLACWEAVEDDVYRVTLEYPVDPEVQTDSFLVGDFAGTLSLQVRDSSAGEDPVIFPAEMEFSVTLPDQSQAQAPEAGTYLRTSWELSPSCSQGALAMRAAVRTDMDLDNPLAQRYYQWTGELSLIGSGGRSVTLPQTGGQPLQWEAISPATSYLYTEEDGYSTVDPLTFALSSQKYPTQEEFLAAYGLESSVEGTLLLTCRESVSGSSRTWTVRIPVTVEVP